MPGKAGKEVRVGHVGAGVQSFRGSRCREQLVWDLEEIVSNLYIELKEGQGEKREVEVHEVYIRLALCPLARRVAKFYFLEEYMWHGIFVPGGFA